MPMSLVINTSRDLESAINKAILFSGLTLTLIISALTSAVFLALKKHDGLTGVGGFLLITSPFIIHSFQLTTTIIVLCIAKKNPQSLTLGKCRFWSVTSRVLTAPILIEMMILIGFKWYLTIIAIPLVVVYFITMLQIEKIMHYFFTRNLSARVPAGTRLESINRDILLFDYPFNLEVNSSFYRLSSAAARRSRQAAHAHIPVLLPHGSDEGPPTYTEVTACTANNCCCSRQPLDNTQAGYAHCCFSTLDDLPPPTYIDAIKFIEANEKAEADSSAAGAAVTTTVATLPAEAEGETSPEAPCDKE